MVAITVAGAIWYREEVEIIGLVTRVLTRLRFSKAVRIELPDPDEHANSS